MTKSQKFHTIVIGAGPAGLTAAYTLAKKNTSTLLLEADPKYVGGLSRTVKYKSYYFDIGGHRFFTKQEKVLDFWKEILPNDFITCKRLSRIYFKKKLLRYPLQFFEALKKTGILTSIKFILSYLQARIFPLKKIRTFEDWATNRFGKSLYQVFFKDYTQKVWGRPCSQISSDWADQRIQEISLLKIIRNTLSKKKLQAKTLIDFFQYPRLGPGMFWETCLQKAQSFNFQIKMDSKVSRLHYQDNQWHVSIQRKGFEETFVAKNIISTMPMTSLLKSLINNKNKKMINSLPILQYRNIIVVNIIYKDHNLSFLDNWIYIHDENVKVGRIQNYKRWSISMVPDQNHACLGLEYFCDDGDDLWLMSEQELRDLALKELKELQLIKNTNLLDLDHKVIKVPKAYPVYDLNYKEKVEAIRKFINSNHKNLYLIGRNGMHQYNNQDHSIMTALLTTDIILNEKGKPALDPWKVNQNAEYIESGNFSK